jgi:hypothetical protein
MDKIIKKIKESHNVALALFALLGFIANELLGLGIDNTALRAIGDMLTNLL